MIQRKKRLTKRRSKRKEKITQTTEFIYYKMNKCKFISAFAANDPSSTLLVWNLLKIGLNIKVAFF